MTPDGTEGNVKSSTIVTWAATKKRSKVPWIVLGAVLVLASVIAGISALPHQPKPKTSANKSGSLSEYTTQGSLIPVPSNPIDAAYQKADALQYKGQYSEAKKIMDNAIAKATSNQEKAKGYSDFAAIALNQKAYQDALEYALKADAIYKTAASAGLVAQSAAQVGDKSKAIEYYTKAISLMKVTPGDENAQAQLSEYQTNLAELRK